MEGRALLTRLYGSMWRVPSISVTPPALANCVALLANSLHQTGNGGDDHLTRA